MGHSRSLKPILDLRIWKATAEVYDKEQNCKNYGTDSVTRSAMQTNLESGSTFQEMSAARLVPVKTEPVFHRHKWFRLETFLMKQTQTEPMHQMMLQMNNTYKINKLPATITRPIETTMKIHTLCLTCLEKIRKMIIGRMN